MVCTAIAMVYIHITFFGVGVYEYFHVCSVFCCLTSDQFV